MLGASEQPCTGAGGCAGGDGTDPQDWQRESAGVRGFAHFAPRWPGLDLTHPTPTPDPFLKSKAQIALSRGGKKEKKEVWCYGEALLIFYTPQAASRTPASSRGCALCLVLGITWGGSPDEFLVQVCWPRDEVWGDAAQGEPEGRGSELPFPNLAVSDEGEFRSFKHRLKLKK